MSNQRRLGRGLEALLGKADGAGEADSGAAGSAAARPELRLAQTEPAPGSVLQVSVTQIDRNPFQPRQDFDEAALAELSESLDQHGLLQPLVVRRHGDRYQLVAGERRLRAAMKAGWTEVAVQLHEADDRQMAELAIVENLQRRDLNALEKAASFQQYLESYHCTQDELAKRLKIDRSTVANLIRLLELPDGVQDSVRRGTISPGHARALLPLGEEREQLALCRRIESESLSVRATETLVQDMLHAADAEPAAPDAQAKGKTLKARPTRSRQIEHLEQELRSVRDKGQHSPDGPRPRPHRDSLRQRGRVRTAAQFPLRHRPGERSRLSVKAAKFRGAGRFEPVSAS